VVKISLIIKILRSTVRKQLSWRRQYCIQRNTLYCYV